MLLVKSVGDLGAVISCGIRELLRNRPVLRFVLVVGFSTLLLASEAVAQARGYVARACGFDMDDDGVVGELLDDCRVCDGVTTDPDGDGMSEDFLYVDASSGSDGSGDGSPSNPYRTIGYAWSVADGPGDGAEDIICFRGVAAESSLSPPVGYSGVPGTHLVARSGSEERDWEYPRDPAMLVGWDYDGDGCYPPYDDGIRDVARCGATGDVAVLDGSSSSAYGAFGLNGNIGYFEIAHFEARDYGRNVPPFPSNSGIVAGFIKFGRAFDPGHQYLYFHDLELLGINRARDTQTYDGDYFVIDVFNTHFDWLNFTNVLFDESGGWFARGVPHEGWGASDAGPMRFKNITRIMLGPDGGSTAGFKLWGYITGVEVIDSVWDTNVAGGAWNPLLGSGWANVAFSIGVCNQDWVIRNNEIIDSYFNVTMWGTSTGFCDNEVARTVDDIVIDRNIFRNTFDDWDWGHGGISIGTESGSGNGDWVAETVEDVTVTNNLMSSTGSTPWEWCILARPGNEVAPVPGQIVIANNTCIGRIRRVTGGAIILGTDVNNDPPQTFMQQNFVVKNNIIDGLSSGDNNIIAGYLPTNLASDYNVFDAAGRYELRDGGTVYDEPNLAGWRAVSGGDASSRKCTPAYVDSAAENYRLDGADTCAQDAGQQIPAITTVDIDNDPRPQGQGWDIGGDEAAESSQGFQRLARPARLTARALSSRRVRLTWEDRSLSEGAFIIQMKVPGGVFARLARTPANSERVVLSGFEPGATYIFRVRAKRGQQKSRWSKKATVFMPQ